jgi:hypothetical protein
MKSTSFHPSKKPSNLPTRTAKQVLQVHHPALASLRRHLHLQHTLALVTHGTTTSDLLIQHTHLHRHISVTVMVNHILLRNCMMQITPITGFHAKSNALLCLVVGPPMRQDTSLALCKTEGLLESCFAVCFAGLDGVAVDLTLEGVVVSAAETEGIDEEFEDVFFAAVV